MTQINKKQYTSINQIISEATHAGSHFFEKRTMRFFSSRILPKIYGGCYFITSERDTYRDTNPRHYTIRKYKGNLDIETVGDFCRYDSLAKAKRAVIKIVKIEEENNG